MTTSRVLNVVLVLFCLYLLSTISEQRLLLDNATRMVKEDIVLVRQISFQKACKQ